MFQIRFRAGWGWRVYSSTPGFPKQGQHRSPFLASRDYLQTPEILAIFTRLPWGRGQPEIFNTDQGVQFTATAFTSRLENAGIRVSMDGKGRCLDNVFVERLWRTVKYEDVYLRNYERVPELSAGLGRFFPYYNESRPHQSLEYRAPGVVWREGRGGR